ncbi:TetR/AcrR family transcriptional regulator [Aquihabitans sp. G128]|uniref:TetR/AcrR family transcriptional regulator n=1 Tax=Aquihabitans sp. G128 TaxID=2849779 RepID=UPI001C2206D7|nr:TetR/AcrR family transcriptional regulator [Aquihabitans sp. G128]QXC59751.1 TetR/AcrR family transcriptional regulator [Aquihabitans sp. G128]
MSGTEGGRGRGQVAWLDAAYEQLAKHGPVTDGRSVSLAAAAKALGMSRTHLYRLWPTSAAMAADLAVHRSTPATGWHAQVCRDDGAPFLDALRRALASPGSAAGVLTRASVATWSGTAAHDALATWERGHLADLTGRLRREWGPTTSGPWTDIAVAVIALVEGMHLMCAQFAPDPGAPMAPDLAEEVTQTAGRIIEFLLVEAEGDDTPLRTTDGQPGAADGPAPTVLPPRVAAAVADGTLDVDPEHDGGRRVVDMGVLARSLGVSERSLYGRWNTPADLNADLFLESVQRVRGAFARILLEVFQSNASGDFSHPMPLFARMNAWFMDPQRFPEATVHLGLVDVLTSRAVLERVRQPVLEGLQVADMQTAALLQASGFRLIAGLRMRSYTMFIVGMGMGSHRTSATHPELLARRLRYLGEDHLASGVGHTAMTRSCTELVDPGAVADGPASEPPLPTALQPPAG